MFDAALIKKKRWRAVAETAKPIVYLPFTEDTFDPDFVSGGRDFLLSTAQQAIDELRLARAPSAAFPGELLADVVPASVISTLAVIEQTDDADFVSKGEEAFNEVLNQYGLKRGEAYRYSVSSAAAIGPMQFTNRRGNGTYSMVVRRCPAARLDPNFERGATDLLNAMKAAICLFDIELKQMRAEIRAAYRDNREVLGIFPVAAYNGGPRNVTKLHSVMKRMKVGLTELGRPGEQPAKPVPCPCVWKTVASDVIPVTIPRYNNENRWYIEKYQSILSVFEEGEPPGEAASLCVHRCGGPLPLARGDRQRPRAQLGARAGTLRRGRNWRRSRSTRNCGARRWPRSIPRRACRTWTRWARGSTTSGRTMRTRAASIGVPRWKNSGSPSPPGKRCSTSTSSRSGRTRPGCSTAWIACRRNTRSACCRSRRAAGMPTRCASSIRRRSLSCPAVFRCLPPRPRSPGGMRTASSSARTSGPGHSRTRVIRARSGSGRAARRAPARRSCTRRSRSR